MFDLLGIVRAAVLNGTPLLFGTSGEILTQKSGCNPCSDCMCIRSRLSGISCLFLSYSYTQGKPECNRSCFNDFRYGCRSVCRGSHAS